jgi:hypothetical protein
MSHPAWLYKDPNCSTANIITYDKSQRLSWFGHINRMPETSVARKIYKWKPFTGRPARRPKSRWEDDVRNDTRRMQVASICPRSPQMEGHR